MWTHSTLCIILTAQMVIVSATYNLEVKLYSYSNPDSQDCDRDPCDIVGTDICENVFHFCVREVRSSECIGEIITNDIEDDSFSFTSVISTLGITNPLVFSNLTTTNPLEFVITIFDSDALGDDLVDEFVLPISQTMTVNSTFDTPETFVGDMCGVATIELGLRITSNCPPDLYGPDCTQSCTDMPGMYECNYLGQRQCIGNFAMPDCTTCLPNYYSSDCSVECAPPTACGNYECNSVTGERVCQGNFNGGSCEECIPNHYNPGDELCCSVECIPPTSRHTCNFDGEVVCIGNFALPDCDSCKEDYYPADACDTFCRPRNDSEGHFTCNTTTGEKICLPGYTDVTTDCTTATTESSDDGLSTTVIIIIAACVAVFIVIPIIIGCSICIVLCCVGTIKCSSEFNCDRCFRGCGKGCSDICDGCFRGCGKGCSDICAEYCAYILIGTVVVILFLPFIIVALPFIIIVLIIYGCIAGLGDGSCNCDFDCCDVDCM